MSLPDESLPLRLAAIVESSDDAIVSKDLNGIVTSWNRAAATMFGYSAAEMIGQSIRRIIPGDRQSEEDNVLARIRRGERVDHFETLRQRKDGTLVPISLTVSPIRNAQGEAIGASKVARDISERRALEAERARLLLESQEQSALLAKLGHIGVVVASTLDRKTVVQAVTDAATMATGAEFGAFFHIVVDPQTGDAFRPYALSGAPMEAFAAFSHLGATGVFAPTFRGEGVVRTDDVTKDPGYGQGPPYDGVPPGDLPVRSYLAVPVRARSGQVLGGLCFGHSAAGVFTPQHERLVEGVATWAAVALENARLYLDARAANELKDEFLATLSHELRTPLNAILGYARMLRAGLVPPERQQRAIETVERNATSLTQIVEDVLDVSRIVNGKIRLKVQPVDLADIVHLAAEAVAPAALAKGVHLQPRLTTGNCIVSADPDRLQQVLWNVLVNAVKFTGRGGAVTVDVASVNSHCEVVISDTGIGIAPDFLPHIFERFRQGEGGTTRERGGLGLGLSIAKHLVEMHGGTIEAASNGVTCGATFRIRLPAMMAARHTDAQPVAPWSRTTAIEIPDLAGIRVVAVDDDQDALRMLSEILRAAGAEVATAGSSLEALGALAAGKAHALIADLGMPRIDGFGLIAQVREHSDPEVRRVPAAALTAYARSEDRNRALDAGFQMHLAKPIDPGQLLTAIAALIESVP
jgi:PAS domain S-box-containing protein